MNIAIILYLSDSLKVLGDMVCRVPVSSSIFSTIAGLIIKLKDASFDFAYEIRSDTGFDDDAAEML